MHDVSARVLGFLSWQPFAVGLGTGSGTFCFYSFCLGTGSGTIVFYRFCLGTGSGTFFFTVFLLNNCFDHFQRFPG